MSGIPMYKLAPQVKNVKNVLYFKKKVLSLICTSCMITLFMLTI